MSRRLVAEALGRAWAFGRLATATCPRDVQAGCWEPPGSRLYIVPPRPELRRALQEGCHSAAGPEAELSDTSYTGGDSPSGAEAYGRPAVAGDWFSRFLRRVIIAVLRVWALGWLDWVNHHLPMPLWLRRWTGWSLPGPGCRSGQGKGLPCSERLDSSSSVQTPPGPPSGAFASPLAPLQRWGPARTVAWWSSEGMPVSGPSGSF